MALGYRQNFISAQYLDGIWQSFAYALMLTSYKFGWYNTSFLQIYNTIMVLAYCQTFVSLSISCNTCLFSVQKAVIVTLPGWGSNKLCLLIIIIIIIIIDSC